MLSAAQRIFFHTIIVFFPLVLSAQSTSAENVRKELNIAFNFERPPFMFDKTSSKGIEADLITEILWDQGYTVNISQMFTQSPNEHLEKALFQRNNYDGISAVVSEKDNSLFYSDHFIEFENYAITRAEDNLTINSVHDLETLNVIAWKGAYDDLGETFLRLFNPIDGIVKENFTASASQTKDIKDFLSGKGDTLVIDQTIFKWFKVAHVNEQTFVYHKIFPQITSFPVAFKSEKVRDDFNAGLAKIKDSGRYNEIVSFYNEQDIRPLLQMASLIADISADYILTDEPQQLESILNQFFIHPDIIGIRVESSMVGDSFVNLMRDNGTIRNTITQPFGANHEETSAFIPRVVKKSYSYKGNALNPSEALFVGDITVLYKRRSTLNNKRLVPDLSSFTQFSDGIFKKIIQSYSRHNLKRTKFLLTATEQKWLEGHRVLNYTGRPDWLPFESFNEQGKYIGLTAEYLKIIESLAGIEFNHVVSEKRSDSLKLINRKAVEVISMDMFPESSELLYTQPLITNDLVILMRDNHDYVDKLADIAHLKIALVQGHRYNAKLINKYPEIDFIDASSTQSAISDVSTGKIDAVILTFAHANHTIKKIGANSVRVVGKTNISINIRLAVRAEYAPLINILNKAISIIPEDEKGRIVDQWIKSKNITYTDYSLFWKLAIFTVFTLLIFIFWNRKLASEMAKRKVIEAELVKAIEKAESATKTKGEFLANMSHEIRTPINSVMGMSYLALKTELTPKQKNYIENVHRSAESLLGIVNDILDFSKIEAGKLTLEVTDFELGDVLADLANTLGLKAEDKGIELLFDVHNDVPHHLMGDPLRLSQILINLTNNAIKFTDQGEVIVAVNILELKDNNVQLSFAIKDTGIGISQKQQAYLFQSFSQADSSTTRKHGGSGLGLAISKKLTELMGGSIEMESVENKGSCFTFSCKFTLLDNVDSITKIKEANFNPETIKVLVVDDNDAAREIIVSILQSFGFEVDNCSSGKLAIEQVNASQNNSPYQLIIMDWKIPELDGVETTRIIQSNCLKEQLPVCIMVTAHGREEAIQAAVGVKINSFLTKPVTPSILFDSIMQAMGKTAVTPNRQSKQKIENDIWQQKLQGADILLVEDNKLNQELALELLSINNINVDIAENGQQAIDMVHKKDYDGVLMDCQMPVKDGYIATKELRAIDKFKNLPILAMTANAMVGDREKALASGMNDHIAKPIVPEKMFKIMANWITPKANNILLPSGNANISAKIKPTDSLIELPNASDSIDIEKGLIHCHGNHELYKKLLVKFTQEQNNFQQQFYQAEKQEDEQVQKRLAHSIKGNAGSLGLTKVYHCAELLEQVLSNDANDKAVVDLVSTLDKEAQKIISQLNHQLSNQLASQPSDLQLSYREASDTEVNELLEALQKTIIDYDTNAINTLKTLTNINSLQPLKNELAQLDECLENFDFSSAEPLVLKIMTRFK